MRDSPVSVRAGDLQAEQFDLFLEGCDRQLCLLVCLMWEDLPYLELIQLDLALGCQASLRGC